MRPVHNDSSGTTWRLMRRGPPPVSQKTIAIIIGTSATAGVTVLVILIAALLCRRLRQRKLKLTPEDGGETPRSPAPSFIQYPPKPVRTSDTTSDVLSTPFSPRSISKGMSEEECLERTIKWPTHVRSKLSQDSGLRVSSLHTSVASNVGAGTTLSGITAVSVSLDTTLADESPTLPCPAAPLSPSSSVLPSVDEKPLSTEPPSGSLASEKGRTQSHTLKVADPETISVPNTPSTSNKLVSLPASEAMSVSGTSNTRSISSALISLPARDTNVPLSAKLYSAYPGLPSSPAALLGLSPMTPRQKEIPPVPQNPYTSSAFLDRPPRKKSRAGSHPRNHSRSLSQPGEGSSKGSSEVKSSAKYASVAYAQAKALESARLQSRSAQPAVQTPSTPSSRFGAPPSAPRSKGGDHAPKDTQSPKPDRELLTPLSSRSRTRPRSHSWSTGEHAPEMI